MIVSWTNKGQFLIEKKTPLRSFQQIDSEEILKNVFKKFFTRRSWIIMMKKKNTQKRIDWWWFFSLSPNFYFLPVSLSIIFATKYSRPFDEIFWPLSLSALPLPVAACPWKNIFCTLISWLFVSWQVTWACVHAFLFVCFEKKQNHVKLEKWMWREWKQSKVCRKCHNSNKQTLTWVQK